MTFSIDLSQNPFFDDYDEEKNFHKILYKPGFAVQARELNQLQTILQEQIARFGQNILKEGTIIKGGNFVEEPEIFYIKLRDNSLSGVRLDVELFRNKVIIGSITGLKAIVLEVTTGLETQKPELNTMFIKYLNTSNNIKEFDPNENINVISDLNVIDFTTTGVIAGAVDTGSSAAVGQSYGVRCGEGVLFQKGHFVRFDDNLTIVSKYTNTPTDVVVGFQTNESIVTYQIDTSLVDNAAGFNNFNAPGADRFKLTPILVTKTIAEAEADESFFAIQQYSGGRVARRRLNTQFNSIESLIEQRTVEESGNYYINKFDINTEASANTSNFNLLVGPGIAYINGKRVETVSNTQIEVAKPTGFKQVDDQDIVADYGQFVIVENVIDMINFSAFEVINLRDAVGDIGTARVRNVTRASAASYRVYLFDIRMNSTKSFKNVTALGYGTAIADIILDGGIAVLKDTSYNRLLFPIGKPFIKSIITGSSDFFFRATSSSSTGGGTSITVTLPTGQSWLYSGALSSIQKDDFIIINTTDGAVESSYSASISGQLLTVTGLITAKTYSVIYTVKKTSIVPAQKTLKSVFVKIDCNTNVGGIYSLGLPDVFSITNIWKGATYDTANQSVLNNFKLTKNDSSNYYGHSLISVDKNLTLVDADRLLIELEVFEETLTGDCYTVDSYVYSGSGFDLENIPVFNDGTSSTYLRDAVDFRPYVTPTSSYAITEGAATVINAAYNPLSTLTFNARTIPVPFTAIETTYQYYTGRKDALVVNENGDFQLIVGTESEFPVLSAIPNKTMELAEISIPPLPSLPYILASRSGKPEYGITAEIFVNRRYTMTDIGQLDTRLKNMESLVALSLLEKSATDLAITDSAGLNRFKNGIFVDNFNDLTFADVVNDEFKSSIDISEGTVHPSIRVIPLDMIVSSANNIQQYTDTALLANNSDNVLLKQHYATKQKNCTTGFYKFTGNMSITPDFDSVPDTQYAPDININIDLSAPFIDFTNKLNRIIPPLNASSTTVVGNTVRNTVTTTTSSSKLAVGPNLSTTKNVGDFITDVRFNQFMRSQDIQIYTSGLRPNTIFWVYFDGKDVGSHVALGTVVSGVIKPSSVFGGQSILSDANGVVKAVFRLPPNTFYVGERKLELIDVDLYNSIDASTSYASTMYNGFNFSITKTSLTTTTRVPTFNINTSSTVSIVNNTSPVPINTRLSGRDRDTGNDPLAQTFYLDTNVSIDTDIFVSKVDLFFATKSSTNGVTVELRETLNGYPTGITIPFSRIHLTPSDINVDTVDGTTATTVTFPSPVALKTNQDYAIVIKPDANDPNYKVWVARTGETDLASGVVINQDSAAGLLFTSTNDKAWTPYQDEDLKFTLYKTTFTSSTGTLSLTNDNHEFISTANTVGNFITNELVFSTTGTTLSANVNVIAGNTVLTGNVNFQSIFTADEYIVIEKGGVFEALSIASANTTALVLNDIPSADINGVADNVFRSAVGRLTYFDSADESPVMVLKQSSAKTGLKFTNDDVIKGTKSLATSTATLINLPISFVQPNVYRSNFSKTRTDLSGIFYNGSTTYSSDLSFKSNNYLNSTSLIRSKSLSLTTSDFYFDITMNATADNVDTSPMVDVSASKAMVYAYTINNDSINEESSNGNSTSKYVTKQVTLADKMDAEDIRVILTAYKPTGSDIKVYVKVLASDDSTTINDSPWSELVKQNDVSSSAANRGDYVEISYVLDSTVKTAGQGAFIVSDVVNYISIDGAVHQSFKKFIVKMVMLSPSINNVPRIKDIRALALS